MADVVTSDPRALYDHTGSRQLRDALGHHFVPNGRLEVDDWAVNWLADSGSVTAVVQARPSSFGTPLVRVHMRTADDRDVSRLDATDNFSSVCTHDPHCDPRDHDEIARLDGRRPNTVPSTVPAVAS